MSVNRSSSIEFLRIVAMLMIVTHHIISHGILPTQVGSSHALNILSITDCLVIFGVNLFVLISGYFLIKLSWKSFLRLMWIIAFYKLFHLFVDTYILAIEHPWYEWIVKPLSGPVSGGGWFVDIYILLMLVSPLLNRILKDIEKTDYLSYLGILLLLDVGYSAILGLHFDHYGYSLLHFITLYVIGYGIRYYLSIRTKTILSILIISLAISILLTVIPVQIPIRMGGYNNPLVMLSSCCIFSLFTKIRMGQNTIINFIAASMFPVYLIHDGGNVGQAFYSLVGKWWNETNDYSFYGKVLILILFLFMITICVDQLRKWLMPFIVQPIVQLCQAITNRIIK